MDMKNVGEIKYMTDVNDSLGSYVYIAKLLGEPAEDILPVLEKLRDRRDRLGSDPEPHVTYACYKDLMTIARLNLEPEMFEAVYGAT